MTSIPVSISWKQKTKMGAVASVSLRPIKDCGNCRYCRKQCYALKAWRMYKQTRKAWTRNGKAFRLEPFVAIHSVHNALKRKRKLPRYFRIHVAGDFLSQDHVEAWALLGGLWPQIKFLAFTKMGDIFDFAVMPENLSVVYSQWPGMPVQGAGRKAWVQDGTETRIPADAIECHGRCEDCGMCWDLVTVGRDVYFHIH